MEITTEADLGRLVRTTRLRQALDQRDLAERAGVSLSALRRLEAGQGTAARTGFAVLEALGVLLHADESATPASRRRAPSLPAAPSGLERRDERTSWFLHRAVAAKLRGPEKRPTIDLAWANLPLVRANVRGPQAHDWLDRWERALDGPVSGLLELMLGTDQDAVDLRQVSPFAGALTDDERLAAIRKAAA